MRNLFFVFLLGVIGLLLASCSESQRSQLKRVPTAFGELNQVVVVMDDQLFDSPVGDSLQFAFSGPYPLLPQPEPLLDLKFYDATQFYEASARRQYRNILFVAALNDKTSGVTSKVKKELLPSTLEKVREQGIGTIVKKDVWAKEQQVVFLLGNSPDDIITCIQKQSSAVLAKIRQQELDLMTKRVYGLGTDRVLQKRIQDAFGIEMKMPEGFIEATYEEEDDFLWFRRNVEKGIWNIFIQELPYNSRDQLTRKGLLDIYNRLGKKYVSSELPDTYMRVNDKDIPMIFNSYSKGESYVVEGRGLWEMENDFMGGPFLSYLYYHQPSNKLYLLSAFVFAPEEEKRDMMQKLDFILGTVKFGV